MNLGLVLGVPATGESYSAPGSCAVDGVRGDHLLLGPALSLTDSQADEILGLLEGALGACELS